jgi:hypothetical protein
MCARHVAGRQGPPDADLLTSSSVTVAGSGPATTRHLGSSRHHRPPTGAAGAGAVFRDRSSWQHPCPHRPGGPVFDNALVANRGEIAVRAFRAAHELGVATEAVLPWEDHNSVHRLKADESHPIGAAVQPG